MDSTEVETGDAISAALARSSLRDLTTASLRPLLHSATTRRLPPGAILRHAGDPHPHVHLVLTGLVRLYVSAPDGRSLTVRYARSGALIGIASLYARSWVLPVTIQTVTATDVLDLRPEAITTEAARDPALARGLLGELSDRVAAFIDQIPLGSFADVRQRVAHHLLDLASARPVSDGPLSADISQHDLAGAVGTVREVVARALRELREEQVIRTERSRIVITDPEALYAASFAGAPGTR